MKRKEVVRLKEPQHVTIEEAQEELNNVVLYSKKKNLKVYNVIIDEDIVKITGDIPMITFKKFSNEEYGIHFGNSEGCNCMKGQNIAVVGTPHMADFLYKLMAYQIG